MNLKAKSLDSVLFGIEQIPKSKGRRYAPEQQRIILGAFSAGMSVFDVHRATGIPIVTLKGWRKKSFASHFVEIASVYPAIANTDRSASKVSLFISDNLRIELSISDLTLDLLNRLKIAI